jgi:hypothetical protein
MRLVLAVLVLATLACGGTSTVRSLEVIPPDVPAPVQVAPIAPPAVQSRDDLARYVQIAKNLGLTFDGKEYCALPGETDGAWYASYSGQYNFCLGVTNGIATSFGGFVFVDGGDAYGFGEDFAVIYLGMGYPNGMLDMIVKDMGKIGAGDFSMLGTDKYYGNLVYRVSTDEDMSAIYVQVLGVPTGPQTPIKLGGNA